MKSFTYLILSKTGIVGVRKNKPYLTSGQVAIKLNVEVSDKFFERFVPSVILKIPDHKVIEPNIKVEVNDPVMDKLTDEPDEPDKTINYPF